MTEQTTKKENYYKSKEYTTKHARAFAKARQQLIEENRSRMNELLDIEMEKVGIITQRRRKAIMSAYIKDQHGDNSE